MRATPRIRVREYREPGRLVPSAAQGLRARSVRLEGGQGVEWHSTGQREELVIALTQNVCVEVESSRGRIRRIRLHGGRCAFLPRETRHRVVNRSAHRAHYLYITAPSQR